MSELFNAQRLHLPPNAVCARMAAQLRAFSRAGDVLRFHTRPQLQPQTVGHHTYGVLWLVWVLMGGKPSANLMYAALRHDTPEFITGDLPSPVKRSVGGDKLDELEAEVLEKAHLPAPELTDDEQRLLHLADCLEGMRHCVKERQLGNQLMTSCYDRYKRASANLVERPHELYVWTFFDNCWREANQ